MTLKEINFLDEKDKLFLKPKRKKLSAVGRFTTYLIIIVIVFFIFFGMGIISSGENLSKTLGNLSLWGQIKHLMGSSDKQIKGEDQDRINILLLGIGGKDHDGPYLTDTMIVASLKPSTKQVALISIPRDLFVPIPGYGWRKINNADALGELKNPGQGGQLATEVVSQVLNLPIHYYVRIDFNGFVQIIDNLGGIGVEVENTVDDPMYPIKGMETATTTERYEHLYIEPGQQHFDGGLALKFVRSRHAKGIEGSDFARSQRQQKVLLAVKNEMFALSTIANPYKISNLMDALSQNLATDLQVWEILKILSMGKNIESENIINRVFDDSPDGPLYSAITSDGMFVLQPKTGDFSELQFIAGNIFDSELAKKTQPVRIEIQNGTTITGLAYKTSLYLQSLGYQIIKTGNAPTKDYQKTVVYSLKQDIETQNDVAKNISGLLRADIAPTLPDWVLSTSSPKVSPRTDILIILGQDQKSYE